LSFWCHAQSGDWRSKGKSCCLRFADRLEFELAKNGRRKMRQNAMPNFLPYIFCLNFVHCLFGAMLNPVTSVLRASLVACVLQIVWNLNWQKMEGKK